MGLRAAASAERSCFPWPWGSLRALLGEGASPASNPANCSSGQGWGSKVQGFGSKAAGVGTPRQDGREAACWVRGCVGAPQEGPRGGYRPPEGPARSLYGGAGAAHRRAGAQRCPAAQPGLMADAGRRAEPPPLATAARLAGPRGGAGRQLDAAAIYGPFRRAGASSGRPLSLQAHNGAAAAAVPAPAVARALHGCDGTGRRGPAVRAPSVRPSVRPPCAWRWEQGPCARRPCLRTTRLPGLQGPCAPTVRSWPWRPLLLRRQAPGSPGWHGPRRCVPGAHTGAHSSRLRATIWQIRVDRAAPAHSGAECPATGNNHNSVRVYYGCERARKKSFNSKR